MKSEEFKKLRDRIEELEKENSSLRQSVRKYKNIFHASPVAIQVVDENGIIVDVNPFHVRHIGKGKTTPADYLEKYIVTRPSIIKAGMADKYKTVLEGESLDEKEVYFPSTTGGEEAYYNIRGVPIKDGDSCISAVFIIEDVTELKAARDAMERHKEKLEILVQDRTEDLRKAYVDLYDENQQRKKAEAEREKLIAKLQKALRKVKTLSGFLPICSSCKKIRDDQGYWNQIELYIRKHSDAEFSHGICPDCAKKLYPDLLDE